MAQYIPDNTTGYEADLDNLAQAIKGNSVLSGGAVVQRAAGANMSVDVSTGGLKHTGAYATLTGGNFAISAADPTNVRIDTVSVSSAGTVSVTAGTPSATPKPPALTAGNILLALVSVAAAATSIVNSNISGRVLTVSNGTIQGTIAARPAATIVPSGTLYFASDEAIVYRSDGSTWTAYSGSAGAPTTADYLVGTAQAGLSAEIVAGTAPGGELGGTWASPTVDSTHSGSAHHNALTLTAEQATTSGTSIDFTGIPAGVKRITVMLEAVSTNGTSRYLIQLGDSGGVETTGYVGAVGTNSVTVGFGLQVAPVAASNTSGAFTLTLQDSANNVWVGSAVLVYDNGSGTLGNETTAGRKPLSAVLDRVRLTTTNGTDTFDAGAVSISYE